METKRQSRTSVANAPWVVVLGPDGSGKTSLIQELQKSFSGANSSIPKIVHLHWCPELLPSAARDRGPVENPHGQRPRGVFSSIAKLFYLLLKWRLGYLCRVLPHRMQRRVVVFDRHYVDLLVDPRRYRFGGPLRFAQWVARLIPQPDLWLVLDADPKILQQRKREVTFDETARQRRAYVELASRLRNAYVLNVARPLPAVVLEARALLLEAMNSYTCGESPQAHPKH